MMQAIKGGAALKADNDDLTVRVSNILGGSKVFHQAILSPLDAHDVITQGIPNKALKYLIEHVGILADQGVLQIATGMSLRTLQRQNNKPGALLSPDQGGRAWKFTEVLERARELLGSQEAAEQWLISPASGLDQRSPIELLTSPAGAELVDDFLGRLEFGVYA